MTSKKPASSAASRVLPDQLYRARGAGRAARAARRRSDAARSSAKFRARDPKSREAGSDVRAVLRAALRVRYRCQSVDAEGLHADAQGRCEAGRSYNRSSGAGVTAARREKRHCRSGRLVSCRGNEPRRSEYADIPSRAGRDPTAERCQGSGRMLRLGSSRMPYIRLLGSL